MKKSIAESKKDFIPKAAMPRIWWVVLASVHQMTEQRQQTNHQNICEFMGMSLSNSKLQSMVKHGLLVKDENNRRVVFGLTDMAYEFLAEYDNYVTCERDATAIGFYHRSLKINMLIRGVAA